MKTSIEHSPQIAAVNTGSILTSLDMYKLTMSQFFYEHEPNVDTTFTFHNRSQERLADHVNPRELQEKLDDIRNQGFTESDVRYLGSLAHVAGNPVFEPGYLRYLRRSKLPAVDIRLEGPKDDLSIRTTGRWALSTFWETVVMREVSNQYNRNFLRSNWWIGGEKKVYDEGNRRLDKSISLLRKNPDLKIIEFGTRRAFSPEWHRHVLGRLATEAPRNLVGTSNVGFAPLTGQQPKGTFAHEAPMGWAALADARRQNIRSSHSRMLDAWRDYYGLDFSIALSDTFGSQFFFDDFGKARSESWKGIRHDSGDPYQTGRQQLAMYRRYGMNPKEHIGLFSDSLTIPKALALHRVFGGVLLDNYGIGNGLTADVGLPQRNHVMKATYFYDRQNWVGAEAVKLSDDAGKHTGSPHMVRKYKRVFA